MNIASAQRRPDEGHSCSALAICADAIFFIPAFHSNRIDANLQQKRNNHDFEKKFGNRGKMFSQQN